MGGGYPKRQAIMKRTDSRCMMSSVSNHDIMSARSFQIFQLMINVIQNRSSS